MTLTEALKARGFTHRSFGGRSQYRHHIYCGDKLVATLNAHEAWEWLRNKNE